MARKILIGLGIVLATFVAVVALQPAAFRVERSTVIAAPAATAFVRVNDFHSWTSWSPFEKLDPHMKRSYSGPSSGVGAGYAWEGSGQAGSGRMTIERSDAPSLVSIKLEFTKPFEATNTATFTFVPDAGGTRVTWAMNGNANFLGKAIHLFVDMDKAIGGEFERGLASLKTQAEAADRPASAVAEAAP